MLYLEYSVSGLTSIDTDATGAIASGEITTLAHEVRDHSVECRRLVSNAGLSSAESAEVLGSLWDNVSIKLESNAALSFACNGNVEEDGGVLHRQ